jgi:hypothetical protein
MLKIFLLFFVLACPLLASSQADLLARADKLLDDKIEYYLLKEHQLHPSHVKTYRQDGLRFYELKTTGSDIEKLEFLLIERLNSVRSLKQSLKNSPSPAAKTQLQLCFAEVAKITEYLTN